MLYKMRVGNTAISNSFSQYFIFFKTISYLIDWFKTKFLIDTTFESRELNPRTSTLSPKRLSILFNSGIVFKHE